MTRTAESTPAGGRAPQRGRVPSSLRMLYGLSFSPFRAGGPTTTSFRLWVVPLGILSTARDTYRHHPRPPPSPTCLLREFRCPSLPSQGRTQQSWAHGLAWNSLVGNRWVRGGSGPLDCRGVRGARRRGSYGWQGPACRPLWYAIPQGNPQNAYLQHQGCTKTTSNMPEAKVLTLPALPWSIVFFVHFVSFSRQLTKADPSQ